MPFDKICYIGCGVTTGVGAVAFTEGGGGGDGGGFGLGGIGLNVIQGARLVGASRIIGIDTQPQGAPGDPIRHDRLQITEVDDVVAEIVAMTGKVDYSFECIGNVQVARQALECCHKGWGESCVIGVAGGRAGDFTRPFQLVTGRSGEAPPCGGAGARRCAEDR